MDEKGDAKFLEKVARLRARRTGEGIANARAGVTRKLFPIGGNSYTGE